MVEKTRQEESFLEACCVDRVSTLETVGSIPLSGVDPIGRVPALSMVGGCGEDSTGQECHVEAVGPWSCVCEDEDHGSSHRGQASSVSTRAEALAIEWYAGGLDATTPVVSQQRTWFCSVVKTTDKTDKTEQAVEAVALPAGPVASARHAGDEVTWAKWHGHSASAEQPLRRRR
ncbi:hypothetical protein COCMIDRAFT_38019 [Bipolaris oryzae ATCC 44560]|uniref:Uncharacterized protein n=1 Tax=Bipolaris oryzae ATCC 44560 TaxID=930090 RepID=W6ZKM6_COCMI|nr:uncharacterized protein COCMIDRAFT_38019 [Bipolaris oryzae ATCC 44560]EUC44126.1 hypothetical protein COCMIDRAFT_38019 [Bipolaris oryzae ATCC 44560]